MRTKNRRSAAWVWAAAQAVQVANLLGEPLSFDRQIGASATGRAKAQWGQRPRSLPPSERGGHPEQSAGVAVPLGACLLWVPARRRRHAVQPKAGGSAHETTVGGRCSPTILVGREGKCGKESVGRPSTRSGSTSGESCVATSYPTDSAVVWLARREAGAKS